MLVKSIAVGYLETNCYIVTDDASGVCAVIDPGDESNSIMHYIEENSLKCGAILITHGHDDHVSAAAAVQDETGAPIFINKKDTDIADGPAWSPPENTVFYSEGDTVEVGSLKFFVIETPGHTPGGVCLICEDALFTGDTLFCGTCGRTDLPGGNGRQMLMSLKRIAELPGNYDVYPGHSDFSTLDRERRFNRYIDMALNC